MTKFWQNYFLGKGFAKTSAHLFLNCVANGKGGVWGGIFHLLLFLFWRNLGRTKNRKYKFYIVPLPFYHFASDYGDHPRHSPRTFPLGLLAPRCLGFLLILAIPALRSGGEGRRLFGGRKESFPQLRLVSAGLDRPAQPTPFLVFISAVCGVASASNFCIARLRRRSSFSHGRPSGNVRGSNASCLPQRV